MGFFPESAKRYTNALAIPLGAGLLALPFAGVVNAVRVVAAAGVVIILWKVLTLDSVTAIRISLKGKAVRLRAASSFIISRANTPAVISCLVVFLIVFPVFTNDYYRDVMTITGMYIVLALGLNIVVGQAGLLNLGYAAFYAIGAYTYAILSTSYGLSFWPGMALGALVAAGFAVFLGAPILKLRGDYFAIVTLDRGEVPLIFWTNWDRRVSRRSPRSISSRRPRRLRRLRFSASPLAGSQRFRPTSLRSSSRSSGACCAAALRTLR